MAAIMKFTVVFAILAFYASWSDAYPNILEGPHGPPADPHGPPADPHGPPAGPHGPPAGPHGPPAGPQRDPRFWVPCNVTETPEPTCADCDTRLVCTHLGGFLIPCWWPGQNHCNAGKCGPEPSDECIPSTTPEGSTSNPESTTGADTSTASETTAGYLEY